MPFGIRPSNVRVCHSTTRASGDVSDQRIVNSRPPLASGLSGSALAPARDRDRHCCLRSSTSMSTSTSKIGDRDWIKVDLHIHTLDDPKDVIDYSAHQLLERAKTLGFGVLAITLHDAVFDRPEVFADAARLGILLIPAAEMRLCGADVIVLNVTAEEIVGLKSFDDLRQLRARRGDSLFTIAAHPFYVFG